MENKTDKEKVLRLMRNHRAYTNFLEYYYDYMKDFEDDNVTVTV